MILSGANGHGDWMTRNDCEARQSACNPAVIWLAWLVMRDGGCRWMFRNRSGSVPNRRTAPLKVTGKQSGRAARMKPDRCTVKDDMFVVPCAALADAVGGAVDHAHYVDMKKRKPSRSFFVLKSGAHKHKGIAMNVCPFCGERIDAPFANDETTASAT